MPKTDPKSRFAISILSYYQGNEGKDRVYAFLASDYYQKNILPLITTVETELMEYWRRFNKPEIHTLMPPGFSTADGSLDADFPKGSTSLTSEAEEHRMRSPCEAEATGGAKLQEGQKEAVSPHQALDDRVTERPKKSGADQRDPITPAPPLANEDNTNYQRPPSQPNKPSTQTQHRPGVKTTKLEFTLPNASVRQSYSHELLPINPVSGLVVKEVRVAEDFGLRFDSSSNRLVGTPTKSGEFQLEIWFYAENTLTDIASARLIVNPDPKSLWQNLPSDRSDPYWKPDEDHQFINGSEGWHLVAGSKRGRSHAQKGTFRDDDFFIFSQEQTGWQIAVVSDGAGSAKYSRRGSAIICKDGGEHLERALAGDAGIDLIAAVEAWQSVLQTSEDDENQKRLIKKQLYVTLGYAAHFALTRIREECEREADLGGTVKDYSSTILIGITKRFSRGVFCASFSIGDGAIGVMHADGTPELLCEPDSGDFSGQTRFLSQDTVTQEELLKRVKFSLVPDFAGMYLMTDGISDPYFQTDKGLEMPERWAQLLQDVETEAILSQRNPESAQRLVTWLDFWSKGEHDDRTLAVIY